MIKQIKLPFIVFTITLTSLTAQNEVNKYDVNGKRHGVWQKNFPDTDQLRYQGQFYHGKEIDTFKFYKLKRKKSVLSAIKVFNPEKNKAEVSFFTSKGKLVSKGQMDGRKYVGTWLYYHKNSDTVMIQEVFNAQGKLDGTKKVFFENGEIAEIAQYKDGQLHGISKIYGESGKLLEETNYSNDKLNGKAVYYNLDGDIKAKGTFKDNLKIGIWEYYANGELSKKVDHDNDKIIYKKQ